MMQYCCWDDPMHDIDLTLLEGAIRGHTVQVVPAARRLQIGNTMLVLFAVVAIPAHDIATHDWSATADQSV